VVGMSGGVASAGGVTCTDSDNFDTADGTNMAGITGWSGSTNNNNIEIDTAQYHAGTASFMVIGDDTSKGERIITERTTGTFTVSFWHRLSAEPGSIRLVCVIGINDGASSFTGLTIRGANDIYRNGDIDTTANATIAEWVKIEIECNLTADTFSVWYGGSKIVTDAAATNNGLNPDRLTFEAWTSYDPSPATQWYDDLCVYTGTRVE